MEQQSETSLQNRAHSAGKWHVDSEVKTASGPVVFPVLLWRCLRHLAPLFFCASSGPARFSFPCLCASNPILNLVFPFHGHTWQQLCGSVSHGGFHQQQNVRRFSGVAPPRALLRCSGRVGVHRHPTTLPSAPLESLLPFDGSTPPGSGVLGSVSALVPVQHLHLLPLFSLCLETPPFPVCRC